MIDGDKGIIAIPAYTAIRTGIVYDKNDSDESLVMHAYPFGIGNIAYAIWKY